VDALQEDTVNDGGKGTQHQLLPSHLLPSAASDLQWETGA